MLLNLSGRTLREGVAIDDVPLDDILPGVTRTGAASWREDNMLDMPLSRDLAPEETKRLLIRLCSPSDVIEERMVQALDAIGRIDTYLAIASPTNAQVVAEVRLVSQSVKALLREYLKDQSSV